MRHDRGDRWMVVETVGDDVFVRYEEKQPSGWGDRLAALIKRLGFKQTPDCGCAERQAKLNRFGWRITRWLRRS